MSKLENKLNEDLEKENEEKLNEDLEKLNEEKINEEKVKKWKNTKYGEGFNYAIEGIFETIRTEKHMKFHGFVTVVVLISALLLNFTRTEIFVIIITIALVWFAELMNTAIEHCVDLVSPEYHILAKKAKDCAAGAVLIVSVAAFLIAYMIFSRALINKMRFSYFFIKDIFHHQAVIIFLAVSILVILLKKILGKGTPLRGGMPSGHSALGGSCFVLINFLTDSPKIFYLSMIMLILILQSRVEGKIHTVAETIVGACFGGLVTYLILILFNL